MRAGTRKERCWLNHTIPASLFFLFAATICGLADSPPEEVMLSVTVIDRQGTIPRDLSANAFVVEEGGVECAVSRAVFGDRPAAVVLLLDVSRSMGSPVPGSRSWWKTSPHGRTIPGSEESRLRDAARLFLAEGHPENLCLVMTAGEKPQILHDFTRDHSALLESIRIHLGGRTAIYDALKVSAAQLRTVEAETKAIVLLSDAEDNVSTCTEKDAVGALSQAGITLCTLLQPGDLGVGPAVARRLVKAAGGVIVYSQASDTVPSIVSLARALRYRYALFYNPPVRKNRKDLYEVKLRLREKSANKGCTIIAVRKRRAT